MAAYPSRAHSVTRKIAIKGYKLGKDGRRLVPDYRHLPVNIRLPEVLRTRMDAADPTT
jgi:hypothetical protein